MGLSLGQAAKFAGVGKTTISRAVSSGRLSATKNADGGYSIDPAELCRVYDVKVDEKGQPIRPEQSQGDVAGQGETAGNGDLAPSERQNLQQLLAVLEERIDGLKGSVEAERRRADAAESDRDRWAQQAERISALLPAPAEQAQPIRQPGLIGRIFGRKAG